ncbi:hypothetical protein [Aquisalimonas sp.]|uniref:hypothetical protein n=1 Tax=Aquisalimonas sp. TaxID=1872621 RepID=UPI0025BB7B13|nr:hypothetical protein [Aquisalimonas sp.]
MPTPHGRLLAFLALIAVLVTAPHAGSPDPEHEGWRVIETEDEGGDELRRIARERDEKFESIARRATAEP